MAKGYRPVRRDQGFLLPPDMREWLPADHLVWFLLDVVGQLDTGAFHARSRLGGVGREGYDPDMLLGLLIYAYCHGVRSSRQIERQCTTDVAFRVLCAQDVPDHTVIARFRQRHEEALAGLFDQVLLLCGRAGLGRFGTVALDGTKIAANASVGANRGESSLRRLAEEMIAAAAAADAAEDGEFGPDRRGDELAEGWRDRSGRQRRIQAALQDIAAERAAGEQASRQRRVAKEVERVDRARAAVERTRSRLQKQAAARAAAERAAAERGRTLPGTRPVPVERHAHFRQAQASLAAAGQRLAAAEAAVVEQPAKEPARNITDPDSRLLPTRGGGWVQGYNCQLAVGGDGLILATRIVNHPADVVEFVPMMHAVVAAARRLRRATGRRDAKVGLLLADAGYASESNLTAPGPDRLIAVGKRRELERGARAADPGEPPPQASAREQMRYRLATPDGIALYRRRGATVEPVNGILKDRRGLRRFSRRGLTAAGSELRFAAAVTNLLKMSTAAPAGTG